MQYSNLESKIEALIVPSLISMGFSVVRIKLTQNDKVNHLQIMAEHSDGSEISLDECGKISTVVSALLDVEDPIESEYMLEVSSPGMERPLIKQGDFEKYSGNTVKINTNTPIDGRRKFKGILLGTENNDIIVRADASDSGSDFHIPLQIITSANIVVTEELLKQAFNK